MENNSQSQQGKKEVHYIVDDVSDVFAESRTVATVTTAFSIV